MFVAAGQDTPEFASSRIHATRNDERRVTKVDEPHFATLADPPPMPQFGGQTHLASMRNLRVAGSHVCIVHDLGLQGTHRGGARRSALHPTFGGLIAHDRGDALRRAGPPPGDARRRRPDRRCPATIGRGHLSSVYDAQQTASTAIYIAHVDLVLLDDGTYFVCDADAEIVACGGWSRRGRLYTGSGEGEDDGRLLDPGHEAAHIRAMFVRPDWTLRGLGRAILQAGHDAARAEGFTRLDLGATLPGVAIYRAFGFREVEPFVVTMPDGVSLKAVVMERAIDHATS